MLDEYIKWREEIKLDTYDFSEIFKILLNDKVFEIIGRDKADRPIIYGRGQYFLPAQMYFFLIYYFLNKYKKKMIFSDLLEQKMRCIYTLELMGRL